MWGSYVVLLTCILGRDYSEINEGSPHFLRGLLTPCYVQLRRYSKKTLLGTRSVETHHHTACEVFQDERFATLTPCTKRLKRYHTALWYVLAYPTGDDGNCNSVRPWRTFQTGHGWLTTAINSHLAALTYPCLCLLCLSQHNTLWSL